MRPCLCFSELWRSKKTRPVRVATWSFKTCSIWRSCISKWVTESAQSLIESLQAEEQKRQQLAERAAQLKAEEEKANTWLVMVDGEVVNISKYTKAKLETVILAEELPIDPLALEVPEGETHASALRMAVRDKLHAKHGIPEA